MLLSFDRVADRNDSMDEIIKIHAAREEARSVIRGIPIVAVQRHIINVLITLVKHGQLPVPESRHFCTG